MADISKSVELILRPNDQGLVQKVKELSAEFEVLGNGTSKFTGFANDLSGGISDVNEKMKQTEVTTGTLENAFGRLGQIVAAYISLQTAQEFVNINIAMDRVKFTLTEVTGGSAEANREFEFLKTTAYQLGLGITELARPYAKLFEATKGTNLEGEVTRNLFLGISEAGAKLGLSTIEVERALKAVEQIASKGRVSLEEVRGQLGDAIPGAVNIFAEAAGLTVDQFFKVVEAGELSSDVLVRVAEILRDKYGVEQGERVETLAAAFGRLKTAVQLFATTLGEAGVNTALSSFLNLLSEGLRNSTEQFNEWAGFAKEAKSRIASEGWTGIFGAIEEYIRRINEAKGLDLFTQAEIDKYVKAKLELNNVAVGGTDAANALKALGVSQENIRTAEVEKLAYKLLQLTSGPLAANQPFFLTRLLEDLNKLPDSNVNLDSFREAAQRAFANGVIDEAGFVAALNAIDTKAQGLWATMLQGESDLKKIKPSFDTLASSLETLGNTAGITGSQFLTGLLSALNKTDETGEKLDRFKAAAQAAFDRGTLSPEEYVAAIEAIQTKVSGLWAEMYKGAPAVKSLSDSVKEANEDLKTLGVDPKQFKFEDIKGEAEKLVGALTDLSKSDVLTGSGFLTGLLSGLDKLKDNDALGDFARAANAAFDSGKISASEYEAAIRAISSKADGTWDSMLRGKEALDAVGKATKDATKEALEQEKALQKQKEKAEELAVKLEQIASNERIKLIESTVKLNIANLEADAKIATAIIEGISKSYESNVGLIGELSKQITDGYSTGDRLRISLIEDANKRIGELHQAQLLQIATYVEYVRAKTAAINSGSPILTVNADGLQPHLEAVMWEIFKQIQIKLAQEGGDLIVGGLT